MRAFLMRSVAAAGVLGFLLAALSCARDTQLVSISVTPETVTVTGNPTIVYMAIGHYIHPPIQKDITSEVLWETDAPTILAFPDPTHPNFMVPTLAGCGTNLGVQAVHYRNPGNPPSGTVVVGRATVNVECAGGGSGTDFQLVPSPANQSVAPGGSTTFTINVNALSGSPSVSLSTPTLQSGLSTSFSPNPVTASGSSTLTVTVSSSLAPGTYTITIQGADATGAVATSVTVTVT